MPSRIRCLLSNHAAVNKIRYPSSQLNVADGHVNLRIGGCMLNRAFVQAKQSGDSTC